MSPALRAQARAYLDHVVPARSADVLLAVELAWATLGLGEGQTEALATLLAGVLEADRVASGEPSEPWRYRRSAVRLQLIEGGAAG